MVTKLLGEVAQPRDSDMLNVTSRTRCLLEKAGQDGQACRLIPLARPPVSLLHRERSMKRCIDLNKSFVSFIIVII